MTAQPGRDKDGFLKLSSQEGSVNYVKHELESMGCTNPSWCVSTSILPQPPPPPLASFRTKLGMELPNMICDNAASLDVGSGMISPSGVDLDGVVWPFSAEKVVKLFGKITLHHFRLDP